MKIDIRRIGGGFYSVVIEVDSTRIDLGLFDEKERAELAKVFEDAIDELVDD